MENKIDVVNAKKLRVYVKFKAYTNNTWDQVCEIDMPNWAEGPIVAARIEIDEHRAPGDQGVPGQVVVYAFSDSEPIEVTNKPK